MEYNRIQCLLIFLILSLISIDLCSSYEAAEEEYIIETQFLNIDKKIHHLVKPQNLITSPIKDAFISSITSSTEQLTLVLSCHVYNGLKFSIPCTFNYTNNGPSDLWLSQRDTPLEGLLSDFLKIQNSNGLQLAYEGVMLRRLPLEDTQSSDKADFVCLSSKQTISVTVDISTVYNFNLPGQYIIQYNSPLMYTENLQAANLKELSLIDTITTIQVNNAVQSQHQLVINLIRDFQRNIPPCKPMSYKGICKPTFIGMPSKDRLSQTTQIHKAVYTYLDPALETIQKDSQHFIRWFGSTSNRRNVQRVEGVFNNIKSALTSGTFAYAYDGMMCQRRRVLGYTWKGVHAIVLCPLQYRFPSILHPYSQLGTALHEMTHSVGFTSDISYNIRKCLNMAITRPYLSVNNAATYGFYFTTIVPVKYGIDSIGERGRVRFMTKGPVYLRYTDGVLDCNYPKLIKNHWGNIPALFHDGFDTMTISESGKVFITKDSLFLRYSSLNDKSPRIGRSLKAWPKMPSSFKSGFDASVQLNGKTYFTRGSRYIRLSNFPSSLRIDDGYPKTLNGNWVSTNLSAFKSNLDAIGSVSNKLCFFKNFHYFCFVPSQQYSILPGHSPTLTSLVHHVGRLHFCVRQS